MSFTTDFLIIDSINWFRIDFNDIGLLLFGLNMSPSFKIGMAFASFQAAGTVPSDSETENKISNGLAI